MIKHKDDRPTSLWHSFDSVGKKRPSSLWENLEDINNKKLFDIEITYPETAISIAIHCLQKLVNMSPENEKEREYYQNMYDYVSIIVDRFTNQYVPKQFESSPITS